jgi:hypothetical protein
MRLFFLFLSLALLAFTKNAWAQTSDGEVAARAASLELAGAFSNDGFKLRDGHWSGELASATPVVVAVNLYAGNSYWFSAATAQEGFAVGIDIFGEDGTEIPSEKYSKDGRSAAGVTIGASGLYYIRLRALEGEKAPAALVYSYK